LPENLTFKHYIHQHSVIHTLVRGPHAAGRQILCGPRTFPVCLILHKVVPRKYIALATQPLQVAHH